MEVKEKFRLDVALPRVTPLEDSEQYEDDFEEEGDLDLGSPHSLSNYTFDETLSEDGYAPTVHQKGSSLSSTKSCSVLSLHRHGKPVHHLGFGSTKIMEIERENKRLGSVLQRRYDLQKPVLHQPKIADKNRPTSSVNRNREQQRIARENKEFLKRLRSAESSKEIQRTEHDKHFAKHKKFLEISSRTRKKLKDSMPTGNDIKLYRTDSKPEWNNRF